MRKRIQVLSILAVPAILVGILLELTQSGEAQRDSGSGMSAFVSTLVRDHIYLFAPQDREALSEMNRQLQELEWTTRRIRNADQSEIVRRREQLTQKVLPLIEKAPLLRNISFDGDEPRLSPIEPVASTGDAGALLLKIDNGSGPPAYVVSEYDFSTIGPRKPALIDVPAPGTYWVLVGMTNIPTGPTTMMLRFARNGKQTWVLPVQVKTPGFGQLRVEILSDETGEPAPAMVRLIWKTDGRDRKPPNSVDLAPQFDSLGNATSQRPANLPGQTLRSFWYLVPGPFEMAVPPGPWEITVRRGVEHVPVSETFEVKEGEKVRRTYRPHRWVDMRQLGWYSGDDHVHGRIVSDEDAAHLMAWIQAEDIHVANVVKMGDISRTFFEQRGFGPAHRVIDRDYILSPGQECPRTHDELGHTLSMNIRSLVRDTDHYFLYDWVFDRVHEQGGLTGYAHVLSDSFFIHRDMSLNVPKGKADFAELMQFARLGTDLYYEFLNMGFKLTASAGSDVPWGGTVGEVRVYAYTGQKQKSFTTDAWFQAVGKGHTFVSNGPMIDFQVDGSRPGDEIHVTDNRKLHVKARAWGYLGHMVPTKLEIIRQGDVLKAVHPSAANQAELTCDFEVDAGEGFWIAARVEGSDQSAAFTTPVYVRRGNLRFWKFQAVPALIEKRLSNLAEIEQLVREARETARKRDAGGLTEMQILAKIRLAEQGDALLERVAESRKIYEGLRQVMEQERSSRQAGVER